VLDFWWKRGSRTVLIVSEAPPDAGLNSAFLRQPDIRLLTSNPDESGLALARKERPRLIIEDLAPNGEEGLLFCEALRANKSTRSIPLIMVAPEKLRETADQAHPDALLLKPLNTRDLFQAVRRFIPLPERRTQRLHLNLRFMFTVDGWKCQAFSRDISEAGVFLKTDRILPLGTRLDLAFRLPGVWDELTCKGVVRYTSQGDSHAGDLSGVGIEFEGLSEAGTEMVATFVERHRRCTVPGSASSRRR
jgi:two-component system cell cycle response regulator DivK